MTIPPHLQRLNPEQHKAVTTIEGPLLILAGAGSGKTRVLTRRVAHLLHIGVEAEEILAVTFTNKAAQEMKERVVEMAGEPGSKVWVSTFHSTCCRILRIEIEALGYTRRFAIYDDDDQLRVLKELVSRHGYDPQMVVPRKVLGRIDHYKNRMQRPDDLVRTHRASANEPLIKLWRDYEDQLRAADAVDFNDLIGLVVDLFRQHPDVLAKWRERFKYLLVDEYQDTNRAQYTLLRMLADQHRNLAVVGDDDQSIYGFRGAEIANILGFQRDFPEAQVVRLEQNYRCSGNILSVANTVVAANTDRIAKKLWTEAQAGPQVTLIACETARDEAERVARAVHKLRRRGHRYDEVAIIYRTNASSRAFEMALKGLGIPHRVVGGRKFYERREVRDVLAYLRLLLNPTDDAALLRIINVPSRGIGAKTLSALREEAASRGEPLVKAARAMSSGSTAAARALQSFVALMDEFGDRARDLEPAGVVQLVVERSGYVAMLQADRSIEGRGRLENVEELVRDALLYEAPEDQLTPIERLRGWLDRIALTADADQVHEDGEVTLMTVHCSKGLEFPVVFVVHMMEGQFPHARAADSDVEEERRLAYVAFTRAMQRLVITRSRTAPHADRRGHRQNVQVAPSRFLFGLPEAACEGEVPRPEPETALDEDPRATRKRDRIRAFLAHHAPALPADASYTLLEIESAEQLQPGVRILHATHGLGTVQRLKGRGQMVVKFAGGGLKSVTLGGEAIQLVVD